MLQNVKTLKCTDVFTVHVGFDAMLIAALLAGVKRTTGLT